MVAADEGLGLGGPSGAVQIRLDGSKKLVELRSPGR